MSGLMLLILLEVRSRDIRAHAEDSEASLSWSLGEEWGTLFKPGILLTSWHAV
jgi:hypothetical protein